MKKYAVSEIDLMLYSLAVNDGYRHLLELYGMLFEYAKCPKCGQDTGIHYKVMKEIIASFGGVVSGIKIPTQKELAQISRDITIWKGLQGIEDTHQVAERVSEYAKRYELTNDMIYRIQRKVRDMLDKFQQMRKIFKGCKYGK